MKVIKRDGREVEFDKQKITIAILSALNETKEGDYDTAKNISNIVYKIIINQNNLSVEKIQDLVEQILMQEGLYKTSKAYILYREEHKKDREYENGLMRQIGKLSKETNRDNANIGHSPASKMYQIGSTASKAYYSDYLIPKKLIRMYNDGLFHIHDYDYYDKTINCLSIPLKRMITNLKDYPFDYGCFANPKRIESAMSIAAIILQRISNDLFGGTMLPNLDITIQELIDEGYIEEPTEKEIKNAIQGLLCDLATMASRAGNQIPFSSITFGLSTGKYGRLTTKCILEEFYNGMGNGETFIFPNLTFKCLSGTSFQKEDPNYDLYRLALKVSGRRMNPTFTFLDAECYKGYNPIEVNIMGCVDGEEIITYKHNNKLYVESFKRAWDRLSDYFESKPQYEGLPHLYMNLVNVDIYDTEKGFVNVKRIIRNVSKDWLNVKMSNGRSVLCTPDHPFATDTRGRILAKDLLTTDSILVNSSQYYDENILFNNEKAWLLGFMICDGCYSGNGVFASIAATGEDDIENKFIYTMKKHFESDVKTVIQNRGVKGTYKDLQVIGNNDGKIKDIINYFTSKFEGLNKKNRHIPNEVFSWDYNSRLSFLAGMIDADGYVNPTSHGGSVVQIGSTNKELSLQQMALAQTLDMPARIYQNHYSSENPNLIRYRIEFYPTDELIDALVCQKKKDNYIARDIPSNNFHSMINEIQKLDEIERYSYDVTTDSDHFEVSGIYSHNCRTCVLGNINGEEISEGRGNLFPTTINLPRIALLTKGINYKKNISDFYKQLDKVLDSVKELSFHRLSILSKLRAKDVPYLMATHVYYKSENLKPEDIIEEVLKQGSIGIGYIGIAETVKCLIGKHHGEDEKALQLALDINKYIRDYCDKLIKETGYNWSCYASPAESTINKVFKDRKDFGIIEGVTDRDFYTNSFHVPVYYPISFAKKITIEGLFHIFNNGGRITYVEFDAPYENNIDAVETIHRHMCVSGVGYAGDNFPIDECRSCGHSGIFNDICTKCGSDNILKIRRVSGYLGYEERINPSKSAEIKSRVIHNAK